MDGLESLRVINRYDMDGVDEELYEMAKYAVFAEPAIDKATDETLDLPESAIFFAVEYLPGQYDQRADSAAQCIRLLKPGVSVEVKFARVILLSGDLSREDVEAIKGYVITPVDSREASPEKPDTLEMEMEVPADVAVVEGFREKTKEELEEYRQEMGFAMSREDLLHIHKYYVEEEKRDPTITELLVIDTYWSDHCRHTTFFTELTDIYFEDGPYGELVKEAFTEYMEMRKSVYGDRKKDLCLMDMASIGAKYLKKLEKRTTSTSRRKSTPAPSR